MSQTVVAGSRLRIVDWDAAVVQPAKPRYGACCESEPSRVGRDFRGLDAGIGHCRRLERLLVEERRSVVRPAAAHRSKGELLP